MASIADMIMNQQQPNFVGNYAQGVSSGLAIDKAREEQAKQGKINDLLQNMQSTNYGMNPQQPEANIQPQIGSALSDGQPSAASSPQPQYTANDIQQMNILAANQDLAGIQKYQQKVGERGIKDTTKFGEEERKNASQTMRSFNSKTREMRSSYTKMKGLADQAKKGSRGARNAMTVSLARLISPGIVTETEAAALSGGQNTTQALFQALSGKGFDVEKLQTYIDPFGETFDADGLLNVGESIVASGRQPLIDMFENAKSRATRAEIGEKALKTNFGENTNYTYLQDFGQAQPQKPLQPTIDLDSMSIEELTAMKNQAMQSQ